MTYLGIDHMFYMVYKLRFLFLLFRSSEARTHTNHVDFEPIYRNTEKARCHRISGSFGRKPLFHVIASQFKVAEAWVLSG